MQKCEQVGSFSVSECKNVPKEKCSFGVKSDLGDRTLTTKWCYDPETSEGRKNIKFPEISSLDIRKGRVSSEILIRTPMVGGESLTVIQHPAMRGATTGSVTNTSKASLKLMQIILTKALKGHLLIPTCFNLCQKLTWTIMVSLQPTETIGTFLSTVHYSWLQ